MQSSLARPAVTRDISYASSAESRAGRAFVRTVEHLSGRTRLMKMARGYDAEVEQGRNFWEVMTEKFGVTLDPIVGSLENIPRTGPLILVSNHPYGILDGLMMGYILSKTRGDFRILANLVFKKSEELKKTILPIDFGESREAMQVNLQTRKTALNYLADGGAIGIFPGGTVSTSRKPFGRPMDPGWRTFTAKLVSKSGAQVVPVFYDGQNSRVFQLASRIHNTFRLALFINEFRHKVGEPVKVAIGEPIDPATIKANSGTGRELMDFLRQEVYRLSPNPIEDLAYGYEFEDFHS